MNYHVHLRWLLCLLFAASTLTAQDVDFTALQGQYQVRIERASDLINIDGRLDESSWSDADAADNFWMSFPVDDRRVDEEVQTDVRLTYDDNFLYIGAICYSPYEHMIPTLKRDAREFWRGDVFIVLIDPVNESTNAFSFGANPAGVQYETLISGRTGTRAEMNSRTTRGSSSGAFNTAWDNKWYVETKSGEDQWTVEMAIPFKTLRFDPEKSIWGINFTRGEPNTNAWHTWSPVPVQFMTIDLGYMGAMIWDEPPAKVKSNISVIPYTLASTSKDFEDGTPVDNELRTGIDAKIAVTSSLNLDLTINPDFSQVEVDQQVTNLTTFNIRFPEKRTFFLENSDLFADFGILPMRPFFSRRIGLDEDGNTIPILYGARLSGNLNQDLRIGAMNMQTRMTDDFSAQNYTSVTLHQKVVGRSVIKGYFHNRMAMGDAESLSDDYNRVAGLEFKYFSQDAKWQGFGGYGLSFSDGLTGDNYFYNIGGGYDGRHVSAYSNLSGIGNNYFADMGWIPFADHYDAERDTTVHVGFQHLFSRFNYTFYPKNQDKVFSHGFSARHMMDVDNNLDLLQNQLTTSYNISFANSSSFNVSYGHEDQQLLFPFDFADGDPLPVGRYHFDYLKLSYRGDSRRSYNYWGNLQYGSFYNGTRFQSSINFRYRIEPWANFQMRFTYNKLQFPEPYGQSDLFLIGPRIEFNFSRDLFWTTFFQYNTQRDNFNINSRVQWRFQPLSDLFVVYTDNYAVEVWGRKNRALVVKLNYWLNL